MEKIKLTGDSVIALLAHAKARGTVEAWTNMACDWIKAADEYIGMAFHPELGWAIKPEEYEKVCKELQQLKQFGSPPKKTLSG